MKRIVASGVGTRTRVMVQGSLGVVLLHVTLSAKAVPVGGSLLATKYRHTGASTAVPFS